jgi:predicted 3-demethylubiquinone-9 3-methyltransferase (glyoxalase superfamily)
MDSAHKHNFTFNEAISFMVQYDTQEEIGYYWENSPKVATLSATMWLAQGQV